jgi:hypothetical protein
MISNSRPLPASIEEAWSEWCGRHKDLPPHILPLLKNAFTSGGMAALHQANAGRYLDVAIGLNAWNREIGGATPAEAIAEQIALLDGTFRFPPGYRGGSKCRR